MVQKLVVKTKVVKATGKDEFVIEIPAVGDKYLWTTLGAHYA